MMRAIRYLAYLACMLAAGRAPAAIGPDPTGLWYDPDESGWGLSISQQGDKLFAVLFVYDSSNRPTWYVASDIDTPSGTVFTPFLSVSGKLYRTSGPWFGGTFDPHAVTMTEVGTLTLGFPQPNLQSMGVMYSIDGTTVSRSAVPQTWGDTSEFLAGSFEGGLRVLAPPATCGDLGLQPPGAFRFQGTAGAPGQLRFVWGTGIDTFCVVNGTYTQKGQLGSISGRVGCGDINGNLDPSTVSGPASATLQVDNVVVSEHGFSGAATIVRGTCTYIGNFGGVRLPE